MPEHMRQFLEDQRKKRACHRFFDCRKDRRMNRIVKIVHEQS